jgi:hypothetical protein
MSVVFRVSLQTQDAIATPQAGNNVGGTVRVHRDANSKLRKRRIQDGDKFSEVWVDSVGNESVPFINGSSTEVADHPSLLFSM